MVMTILRAARAGRGGVFFPLCRLTACSIMFSCATRRLRFESPGPLARLSVKKLNSSERTPLHKHFQGKYFRFTGNHCCVH